MKNSSQIETPVKEKLVEISTHQEKYQFSAKFRREKVEMVVEDDQSLRYVVLVIRLENHFDALKQKFIVESGGDSSIHFLQLLEYFIQYRQSSHGGTNVVDISFADDHDDNNIENFLVGQHFQETSLEAVGHLNNWHLFHLSQESVQ